MYLEQRCSDDEREGAAELDCTALAQRSWNVSKDRAALEDPFPTVDEILDRVTQKTKSVCQF